MFAPQSEADATSHCDHVCCLGELAVLPAHESELKIAVMRKATVLRERRDDRGDRVCGNRMSLLRAFG